MRGVLLTTLFCGALAGSLLAAVAARADGQPPVAAAPAPADASGIWSAADYLAWSVSGDKLPALVTTSPPGTPQAQAGVLGAAGTKVLFGDSAVNDGWRSGGRLRAGYWFDRQAGTGIEASFFGLEQASTGFNASSNGDPILARPFVNALTGLQDSALIAFPALDTGSVTASDRSDLFGGGALYRQGVGDFGAARWSALIGYRYLHATDRLDIADTANAAASVTSSDSFGARSDFHGLDLGLDGAYANGPWKLGWRTTLALGANLNRAEINGSTSVTTGGGTTVFPGGFLALSSNSGSFSQSRFAVVPALALNAGYQFAPGWSLVAGYDLLFWTNVQRAGKLIDATVNPNLIPPGAGGGPQRPATQLNTSDLVAQGFSIGVKVEF